MTLLTTNLRNTRASARQLSFEPHGANLHTDVQSAIDQASLASPAVVPTAVAFAASPYTVLAADTVIYVDTSGGAVQILLPAQATRSAIPLSIKDVTGNASTNNITLTPSGAETVDGLAPYLINGDFGGVRLNPLTGGYTVAP